MLILPIKLGKVYNLIIYKILYLTNLFLKTYKNIN